MYVAYVEYNKFQFLDCVICEYVSLVFSISLFLPRLFVYSHWNCVLMYMMEKGGCKRDIYRKIFKTQKAKDNKNTTLFTRSYDFFCKYNVFSFVLNILQ